MTTAERFTKKPVTVEAVQVPTKDRAATANIFGEAMQIAAWCGGRVKQNLHDGTCTIMIPNEHGYVAASPGDWVIQGTAPGDYYPCRDEVFRDTYQEGEATPQPKQINIDLAGAMEKITPEMLAVADDMMSEILTARLKRAEAAFRALNRAICKADPKVLTDTLWMQEGDEPNCTAADFIALECQAICHPDQEFSPDEDPDEANRL